MQALWIAKTGLDAQQTRMAQVSNNLANVNTMGFKRDRAVFEDLLYQTIEQAGAATSQETEKPTGLNIGTGVRIVGTEKNFSQGSDVTTDNPLDMLIEGRGFFEILLPDGTQAYSRNGSFKLNSEGQVVTAQGYQLQPAITIPDGVENVTVAADGTVQAKLAGNPQPATIGSIQLIDFLNPAGLQPRGQNLYMETQSSGAPQSGTPGLNGLGNLRQGALEGSNVNVVEELVAMIQTQRAYEMNSKAISTGDQMLQYLNNNL